MRVLGLIALLVAAALIYLLSQGDAPFSSGSAGTASDEEEAVGLDASGRRPAEDTSAAQAVLAELASAKDDAARAEILAKHRRLAPIPFDAALVKQLVEWLRSDDDKLRSWARTHLGRMDARAGPFLVVLLEDERAVVRVRALSMLSHWRWAGQEIPPIDFVALLDDESAVVATLALHVVAHGARYDPELAARLTPIVGGTIPDKLKARPLAPGLVSSGPASRPRLAAEALARMGPDGVEALRGLLAEADSDTRGTILRALAKAPPEHLKAILSDLTRTLWDADDSVRNTALLVLQAMEGDCVECLPVVRALLADENGNLVYGSIHVLAQMGPRAESAVPALIDHLKSPDEEVVDQATRALGAIRARPDLVLPALTALILEEGSDVAALAMAAYGRSGYERALEILRGDDPDAQHAALLVLAQQGEAAAGVVSELIPLIEGEDIHLSARAVYVIQMIGPRAAAAAPAVAGTLRTYSGWGHAPLVGRALQVLGPSGERALKTALRVKEENPRIQALRALQPYGLGIGFALDEVEVLLRADQPKVRHAARQALIAGLNYEAGFAQTPEGVDDRRLRALLQADLERLVNAVDEAGQPLLGDSRWYKKLLEVLDKTKRD